MERKDDYRRLETAPPYPIENNTMPMSAPSPYQPVTSNMAYPMTSNTTMVSVQQPAIQGITRQATVPDDYMGLAIFATICCFWPVGIFAILKARDVHKRTWQGDTVGALQSSQAARRFSFIALAIGIIGVVISIIFIIISVVQAQTIINTIIEAPTEAPHVNGGYVTYTW